MEAQLAKFPNSKFLFTEHEDDKKAPYNLKQNYRNNVKRKVWTQEYFVDLWDETGENSEKSVGTHSNRKYQASKAKKRGARKEQVEYRGRWVGESNRGVCAQRYLDKRDDYVDAWVAAKLCEGGPIKYDLQDGVDMTVSYVLIEATLHAVLYYSKNRFINPL